MTERVPLFRSKLPAEEEGHARDVMGYAATALEGFIGAFWANRQLPWANMGPTDSEHYYVIYPEVLGNPPVYFYSLLTRTGAPLHTKLGFGMRHFERYFNNPHQALNGWGSALIFRGASIIRLAGEPLEGRIYFSSEASAHEILEEAYAIERDFPGRFAVNM